MSILAVVVILSILLSCCVTAWVVRRAKALHLVQSPNHRSSHTQPTPNGGGVGIVVAGSLIGAGLILLSGWMFGWILLVLALVLAIAGLFDDIRPLSARVRFGLQLLVSAAVLFALGDMPDISFEPVLSIEIGGWFLFGMLLLASAWWINLFNFMDGIDGLAGMQAVFMLVAGAALTVVKQPNVISSPMLQMMLCVAAATAGFLLLNWPPAKIFMGDVGSIWLALMVFVLALLSVRAGWLNYASWLILGALFVTDASVTLVIRMLRGERWYDAHRSHAYQRLSRKWQRDRKAGHRAVTLLALGINLFWLAPLALATLLFPPYSWLLLVLAYGPLFVCIWRLGAGRPDDA